MAGKKTKAQSTEKTDEFDWDEYLLSSGAEAAKPEYFFQSSSVPENLFEADMKLEANDPRCPNSMCIATVISCLGPRIRLRLDGTDAGNDFWILVDSHQIHPIGYAEARGLILQPPLGFQSDISQWPKYLHQTLQNCRSAGTECFKDEPLNRPRENMFKVGMKLEAVDRKNPYLICPATVVDVLKDEIIVNFDGWGSAFNTKFRFDSRDIFPVGWARKANHPLQAPPKRKFHASKLAVDAIGTSNGPTPHGSPIGSVVDLNVTSGEFEGHLPLENGIPSPSLSDAADAVPLKSLTLSRSSLNKSPTLEELTVNGFNNSQRVEASTEGESVQGDARRDSKLLHKSYLSKRKPETSAVNGKPLSNKKQAMLYKPDVIVTTGTEGQQFSVYLHSDCVSGILNAKNLQSHTIGPCSVNRVLQETVQTLLNCVPDHEKARAFNMVSPGNGPLVVFAELNNGKMHLRHLPMIGSTHQYWSYVRQLLQQFQCCKNFVSKDPTCSLCSAQSSSDKKQKTIIGDRNGLCSIDLSRKRRSSSSSKGSCDQKHSPSIPLVPGLSPDPCEWTVEDVCLWIGAQKDSSVNVLCDVFRKNEIDGKALILLDSDIILKYMSVRLGPALKVQSLIDQLLGVTRQRSH